MMPRFEAALGLKESWTWQLRSQALLRAYACDP